MLSPLKNPYYAPLHVFHYAGHFKSCNIYLLFRCLYTQAQDTCEQTLDTGPWLTQAGGVKK